MTTPLRVLMVEDQEEDALIALRQLRASGYAPEWRRVEDGVAMREALVERTWDLVLSDWSLPQFSGLEALEVLRATQLDIPFIIVSGTLNEETAVDAMLAGARDFIGKGRLARLGAAIERELATREHRSARRRAEEALARTEKLRALGQMAAGISHDLKNLLSPMHLYLQLIERAIDRGESTLAKEALSDIKHALTHSLEALERFRNYGRHEPASRVRVELDHVAHEARELARPRAAAHGGLLPNIVEEFHAPRAFMGESADVVSALVNLIGNAIDALDGRGGTITLRTGETKEHAWVEIADDGPGMPPDVERRVFEPFFTTKGEDGTGLGLAMVYACVERHRGEVTLKTAPGQGTTFRLSFPL